MSFRINCFRKIRIYIFHKQTSYSAIVLELEFMLKKKGTKRHKKTQIGSLVELSLAFIKQP